MRTGFWWGNQNDRNYLKRPIFVDNIKEVGCQGVDWIRLDDSG